MPKVRKSLENNRFLNVCQIKKGLKLKIKVLKGGKLMKKYWRKIRKFLVTAKAKILLSYFVLILFSTVISLIAIHRLLIVRLEQRIDESLIQEVEEFRRLAQGINPYTGRPFGDDVGAIFDVFLTRNVPLEYEFLLSFKNGQFYKSSHIALPESLDPNSELMTTWAKLNEFLTGNIETKNGILHYLVEPVKIEGETRGLFVVVSLPGQEYEEINQAVLIVGVVEAIMAIIALTSSLTWLGSSQILSRLRLLTEAARSINYSDLNQRIPVQGKDEVAELTLTFNQMLARLQAAFNSQQDFLNDAGHELRTPLTIVRCYLEEPSSDPQEQQEALAIVKDELNRMTRLIEDLLVLAKAERPDFLNLEIVDVSNFTDRLYAKVQSLGDRDWQLEAKGSGHLLADPQRLTEAFLNLAENAVQHTKEGQIVTIGSCLRESNACFWVRDTGTGIPLAEQKRIFERFYRGRSGSRSQGFGLGLAIVKKIAEAHGGDIKLISQPGSGSTFTILIPLERNFEKPIQEDFYLASK